MVTALALGRKGEKNLESWNKEKHEYEIYIEGEHEQRVAQQMQKEEKENDLYILIQPDSLDNTVCARSHAIVSPSSERFAGPLLLCGQTRHIDKADRSVA